jgi:alpha-glucosidase
MAPRLVLLWSFIALGCAADSAPDVALAADDPTTPVADCFATDSSTLGALSLGEAHEVGGFRVTVDADGRIDVRHAQALARTVFATAPGGPVAGASASLSVVEHQGSFEPSERIERTCGAPVSLELRGRAGLVAVRGQFADAACAGVSWDIQLCEAETGQLAFRATTSDPSLDRLTLRVASRASERIFGMGEQAPHDRLDLKGRTITVLSQEGGVGRGHVPISPAVNAISPGSAGSEGSTYYAAPHYLTSDLRSLLLENTELSVFDFTRPDVTTIAVHAPVMMGRILYGTSPLELIERFTAYAGRMPAPPTWVDRGAIVALARDLPTSRTIVQQLQAAGVRLAAVWNQTWSGKVETYIGEQVLWNWVLNERTHPGWTTWVGDLASAGARTLCYVNPMLVDPPASAGPVARNLFREARDRGYLVTRADGTPYLLKVTAFDVGLLDLTNVSAWTWMKQVLRDELIDKARCSGWMVDFGEALPFDAQLASGVSAASYHNRYPVEWMRLNREAIEEAGKLGEILTFNRSGFTRTPAHSLMVWQGDQLTTWDRYDGLVSAMHGLINGGFSGISLNHSDTGGYTSLSLAGLVGYEREAELLARWTEMNAFTALLRTHEGNQPGVNAQVYTDATSLAHFARFSKVYAALASYRRQLFAEAESRGWPVVRHLWLHYPDDPIAQTTDDEFLLGREILVAPVKNKCWTWPVCPYDKDVYLPAGRWVHLWSGVTYGDAARGQRVSVRAPIGQPAVFYREGSTAAATFVSNLRAAGVEVPVP